jgi:ribosomal-protein-alanine N-acetyltransferase
MFDPLTTARLVGERPRAEHRDGLLSVFGDPRVGDVLWPGTLGGPRNAEQVQELLERDAAHWEREGFGPWTFRERDAGGGAAGAVVARGGLTRAHVNDRDEVEIDYAVAPSRWGEGLATEIARDSVRVAFEELGLPDVVAFTRTSNIASQRVMEKAGLRREIEFEHVELAHVLFRARDGLVASGHSS